MEHLFAQPFVLDEPPQARSPLAHSESPPRPPLQSPHRDHLPAIPLPLSHPPSHLLSRRQIPLPLCIMHPLTQSGSPSSHIPTSSPARLSHLSHCLRLHLRTPPCRRRTYLL